MKLGQIIVAYRKKQDMSVRDLAKEIGTSSATLNRIERGFGLDAVTFGKIISWLTTQ